MTDQLKRWLLWSLTLGFVAGCTLIVAAYRQPIPDAVTSQSTSPRNDSPLPALAKPVTHQFTAKEFRYVWHKRLQRPIVDPPPPPAPEPVAEPKPQPVARPPLELTLLGTLVDTDREQVRAWIINKSRPLMIGIGDRLPDVSGEATVAEIGENSIIVQRDQETVSFQLSVPILFTESEKTDSSDEAPLDD